MRVLMPSLALSVALLAACTAERAPADADPARSGQAPAVADAGSAAADPAAPPPMANDPATPSADAASGDAKFTGYGDITFATDAADMAQAWGGELKEVGKEINDRCYFMTPAWSKSPGEFNFMISEGKFVRYATHNTKFTAPGGGKVGMRESELQALYKQGLQAAPHHYVEGGKYLSVAASGVSPAKLVFATDAEGVVTEWRVGLAPEVDYVEGCS